MSAGLQPRPPSPTTRRRRRDALVGDCLRHGRQRHQGRFGPHRVALAVCTTTKVEGSRSNGSVPAIGAKLSNAGPMELAMRAAISASTGTPATLAMAII